MWNQFNTADYEGMIAETITISGYNGDRINAYFARPLGSGLLSFDRSRTPPARLGRAVQGDRPALRTPGVRGLLAGPVRALWSRDAGRHRVRRTRPGRSFRRQCARRYRGRCRIPELPAIYQRQGWNHW